MWSRANLKANAKVAFKRNYWKCVVVALILMICAGSAGAAGSSAGSSTNQTTNDIISGEHIYDEYDYMEEDILDEIMPSDNGSSILITSIIVVIVIIGIVLAAALQFFLFGPLEVGCCNFFKCNAYEKAELNRVSLAFQKEHYFKMAGTIFLRNVYIALWTCLFIIPGLIKAYEYRMVSYILADCPDISRQDAFRISKEMMMGNKMDAFVLDLSFFGWSLLAAITCNIAGVFYVQPYIAATDAELFIAIREEYFQNQRG